MIKILLFCLFFIAGTRENLAQLFPTLGGQRAGISTAQFLKIGVGGRATSMGDAFVAISDDASALFWNPAGIILSGRNQIIFSHNDWLVDIKHEFIGGVYQLSNNDAVGLSLTSLHMDDMPVTTEFNPFGTGEFFSFGDIAIAFSYSRKMTDQFSFGGTIRYIEETLDKLKMRGLMVDLGTMYYTGLGSTRFAVAVTNFGNQLTPDGTITLLNKSENSEWQSFSPPTMFRIGFAFEPYQDYENKITTSIQLNHPNDNSENVSLGFEYSWRSLFFARGGYKINVDEEDLSFGAGVNIPLEIADVAFDYSFVNFSGLGSAHRFSILFGF